MGGRRDNLSCVCSLLIDWTGPAVKLLGVIDIGQDGGTAVVVVVVAVVESVIHALRSEKIL